MNAIFCLSGKPSTHKALCKIINELDINSLFVICRSEEDLSSVEPKITERYFRNLGLTGEYPFKIGYNELTPLDKEVLDAFSPYLYSTIKMYERLLDVVSSFDVRMQQIWKHVTYWNYIMDNYKIDLCVLQTVPHQIYDYIIYALCKIKNIKVTFVYENPLLTHSYAITDLNEHCIEIEDEYKKLCKQFENADIDDILLEEEYQYTFDTQCDKDDTNKVPYYIKNIKADVAQIRLYKNARRTLKERITGLMDNFKKHGVVNYIKNIYMPVIIMMIKYKIAFTDMNKKLKRYFKYWEDKC